MKRSIRYILLIGLVFLVTVISSFLESRGIQPRGWLAETLWSTVCTVPSMLLFYTAGYDPRLKGFIPVYARILFWLWCVLFVLGRILPYIPWLQ